MDRLSSDWECDWVFGIEWWQKITKMLIMSLVVGVLVLNLESCGVASSRSAGTGIQTVSRSASPSQPSGNVSEVSPPEVIQQLRQALESYQPQVAILSPRPDEVLQDNTVNVQLQVQDLTTFKNQDLDMGPHLHVILDNQPYMAVYDLKQPLTLPELEPGTHTIRVFASRPWHESFKNEGAYAQTTFHIFTKTQDNNPDPAQPLLTYSRPKGNYGAEPILLDFYLTNAPLHIVAQENPKDDIADWRIRCTVNGNSFVLDRWQAVYLKGFKPGKNWVQLEFLDEQGNPVKNVFNNTVRLINYEPKGKDTLSQLVRGELSATEARGIVTLSPPTLPEEPSATPSPSLPPTLPEVIEAPSPESIVPEVQPEPENTPELQPLITPQEETAPEVHPVPSVEPEPKQLDKKRFDGFFNRFRRPITPSPDLPPTLPEIIDPPASELVPSEGVPGTAKDAPAKRSASAR